MVCGVWSCCVWSFCVWRVVCGHVACGVVQEEGDRGARFLDRPAYNDACHETVCTQQLPNQEVAAKFSIVSGPLYWTTLPLHG